MRFRIRSLLYLILTALFLAAATKFLLSETYYNAARYAKSKFIAVGPPRAPPVVPGQNDGPSAGPPPNVEPELEPEYEFDIKDGEILSADDIVQYLESVTDWESRILPRMGCRPITTYRYDHLRPGNAGIHYLFAINLRDSLHIVPRLLGTVLEVMHYLGSEHCALSIVEGHSGDGTQDVLAALVPVLRGAGVRYSFQRSDIDPAAGDRVGRLARLRNLALEPLLGRADLGPDPTVVFLNDVAACPNDVLELAHQRRHLGADMTCAMDWTHAGDRPSFYDVWIARGMTGDTFFRIPDDGSWEGAWDLFWNDGLSGSRLDTARPFQVFSCWNGAAVFGARPLLAGEAGGAVSFRSAFEAAGECYQGEPVLFCKDLWFRGHGRIAVVPSVSLEYSDAAGEDIKREKGWTEDVVAGLDPAGDLIDWQAQPPAEIKCAPGWQNQHWQKWDQGLT